MRRTHVALLVVSVVLSSQFSLAQAPPNQWRLLRVRTSLLGTHYWYQQTHRGVDVLDGVLVRHVYDAGDVIVRDRGRALGRDVAVAASISRERAMAAADGATTATLNVLPGPDARLVWAVIAARPSGSVRVLVDANSGDVIRTERLARNATGTGRVFNPNPVVTLQDPTLTDEDNADYPALAGAYQLVTLTRLDGSGLLRGDFADARNPRQRAFSAGLSFEFDRSSPSFEEAVAYFHLTTAQEYIQSLGFTGATSINAVPQQIIVNGVSDDQSFFDPSTRTIVMGAGGVDDAEDADILNHEYGHALYEDVNPGFGASEDAAAINEGLADYWAITMSQPVNNGYDVPCVGDWDARGVGIACLIRTDTDFTTADRNGEPHFDGQIISRAMWDVNQTLGRDAAATILLESLFAFTADVTFVDAAAAMIDTALRLFGRTAARAVADAFARRGIGEDRGRTHTRHEPRGGPGFHGVARVFTEAPGGIDYLGVFEPYALTDQGAALFAADVSSGGQAVFVSNQHGVSLVARSGDPAPGGGDFGLGVLPGPGLSTRGDVAFSYILEPFMLPFGLNAGVYQWSGGTLTSIVVPGATPAPGGDVFVGAVDKTGVNAAGAVAFSGMVPTALGISGDLGVGVYVSTGAGIATVAAPGTPAPGGGAFDYASEPAINDGGDIAFTGHLAGRPCLSNIPQTTGIGCVRDLFVRDGRSTVIRRIIGAGDPAPGGGAFRDIRYPVLNARGDILFRAVIAADNGTLEQGYFFLGRAGQLVRIARTGDAMPGGGAFLRMAAQPGNWDLNDRGDVAFSAALNTFNQDFGIRDHGLYRWSDGRLSLVTRSSAELPAGTVFALQPLGLLGISTPFSGAAINNSGQLLFQATVIVPRGDLDTVLYVKK